MATVSIKLPAKITLANEGKLPVRFVPYRENFTVVIQPSESIELEGQTAGQVLYYLAQATDTLKVTQEAKEA